jgi:glutathione S-transferase
MKGLGTPGQAKGAQPELEINTVLALYDKILPKQKYIAGDEWTLADLFHLPNGAASKAGKWKASFAKYSKIDKWFEGFQESETWLKAATEARTIPSEMACYFSSYNP